MDDQQQLEFEVGSEAIAGDLAVPPESRGLVVFAHGSGSSRHSRRNRQVAAELRAAGFGTLLLDLLTASEELGDRRGARSRFDIPRLAARVALAVDHLGADPEFAMLPVGLFGASTGAAAALVCAAERPALVRAVVSRGGRPDLAGQHLGRVVAPTLLIVGGDDLEVLSLNRRAQAAMTAPVDVEVVPGAGHLFEEPGALERVAQLARTHLARHLVR